jgi:hypothetical protein
MAAPHRQHPFPSRSLFSTPARVTRCARSTLAGALGSLDLGGGPALHPLPRVPVTHGLPPVPPALRRQVQRAVEGFCDNLRRYRAGQPPRNVVDEALETQSAP